MNHSVDVVVVHFEGEGGLDLRYCAVEGNLVVAGRDFDVRETLGLDPGGDFIEIVLAHAEARGVLRDGQVLVEVGRFTVAELRQELVHVFLLRGGKMEIQRDAVDLAAAVGAAEVGLGAGEAVHVAVERDFLTGIDRAENPVGDGGEAQVGEKAGDQEGGEQSGHNGRQILHHSHRSSGQIWDYRLCISL